MTSAPVRPTAVPTAMIERFVFLLIDALMVFLL
jgi:hypothetical protein